MAGPFRLVTELTGYDADGAEAVWHPTGVEFGVSGGVARPPEVPLIAAGRLAGSLVSPRTAREFSLTANGANSYETPEALSITSSSRLG